MDWEKNRLAIGAIALVAIIGIAVWASQRQEEQMGEDADTEVAEEMPDLLPDLDKDEIDELEIHRPDTPVVRLTKVSDGEWRVAEPVDAPADLTTVNTALDKLDEMTMVRIAATNSANHERLEVTPETGIRVIVRGGGSELANLIFGTYGNRATMIRPEGEDRVAAAEGSLKFAFNKEVKDWRNRRVVDVPPADVVAIHFQNEQGSWRFERGEGDEWGQAEGEQEIERFGSARVQSTVSSLARMRATDFAPEEIDAAAAGLGEGESVVTLYVRESSEDGDEEGEAEGEGEGEAEEEGEAEAEAPMQEIVLRLGNEHTDESNTFYLMRDGDPVMYLVSSYLAERIDAGLEDFQTAEPGEEGAEGAAPPPGMPGMPPGGPHGGAPPGGGQIPPEVMQQIQQQIQQQQAAGGGAH
jgi:hypothetical protein